MAPFETIQTAELKRALESGGQVTVIETLPAEAFAKGHIPGAINIPTENIEKEAPERLRKDDDIIVYCANTECQASSEAARTLEALGFAKVRDYEAGKEGWKAEGHELTT